MKQKWENGMATLVGPHLHRVLFSDSVLENFQWLWAMLIYQYATVDPVLPRDITDVKKGIYCISAHDPAPIQKLYWKENYITCLTPHPPVLVTKAIIIFLKVLQELSWVDCELLKTKYCAYPISEILRFFPSCCNNSTMNKTWHLKKRNDFLKKQHEK